MTDSLYPRPISCRGLLILIALMVLHSQRYAMPFCPFSSKLPEILAQLSNVDDSTHFWINNSSESVYCIAPIIEIRNTQKWSAHHSFLFHLTCVNVSVSSHAASLASLFSRVRFFFCVGYCFLSRCMYRTAVCSFFVLLFLENAILFAIESFTLDSIMIYSSF